MQFRLDGITQFKALHKKGVAGVCLYKLLHMGILYVAYSFYFNIIAVIQSILGDYLNTNRSCSCPITSLITALVFFYSLDFQAKKDLFV